VTGPAVPATPPSPAPSAKPANPPAKPAGPSPLARFWKRHGSLVVLLVIVALILFLYFGIARDARSDIRDATEGWRGGTALGLYLAFSGTILTVAAQAYSLVKRSGSPKWIGKIGGVGLWLNIHIALSVFGFLAVLVHAGFPYRFRAGSLTENAFAGLATWLLLVTTVSGVFGRYLYRRLPALKRAFRYWKETHLVVTVLFFVFVFLHILGAED